MKAYNFVFCIYTRTKKVKFMRGCDSHKVTMSIKQLGKIELHSLKGCGSTIL